LKIKLKGHHFDTTEVIEAELQAVLNTLTEHNFQDAFENDRSAGNGPYILNNECIILTCSYVLLSVQ
jgi:hypothetical protein